MYIQGLNWICHLFPIFPVAKDVFLKSELAISKPDVNKRFEAWFGLLVVCYYDRSKLVWQLAQIKRWRANKIRIKLRSGLFTPDIFNQIFAAI